MLTCLVCRECVMIYFCELNHLTQSSSHPCPPGLVETYQSFLHHHSDKSFRIPDSISYGCHSNFMAVILLYSLLDIDWSYFNTLMSVSGYCLTVGAYCMYQMCMNYHKSNLRGLSLNERCFPSLSNVNTKCLHKILGHHSVYPTKEM